MKTQITGLFVGTPTPLDGDGPITAYRKRAVEGPLWVSREALEGDAVEDLKHHGGPDRVVHQLSVDTYALLKGWFPQIAARFTPGSYGENLCAPGMTDAEVCVGDVYQVGGARLQVTEPRDPCGLIDRAYGAEGIMKRLLEEGRCGWLYRVLEEGAIRVGDEIRLLERTHPRLTIQRILVEIKRVKGADVAVNREALACPALSARYRAYLEARL